MDCYNLVMKPSNVMPLCIVKIDLNRIDSWQSMRKGDKEKTILFFLPTYISEKHWHLKGEKRSFETPGGLTDTVKDKEKLPRLTILFGAFGCKWRVENDLKYWVDRRCYFSCEKRWEKTAPLDNIIQLRNSCLLSKKTISWVFFKSNSA